MPTPLSDGRRPRGSQALSNSHRTDAG